MTSRSGVRGMVAGAALSLAAVCAGCTDRPPATASAIVMRSVIAHGGGSLTRWRTMEMNGRVRMQDGIAYNAAYRLYARAPGRLRVEHDLTADRGRAFYEYFLNDGVAWTRRNLVVSPFDAARARRLFDQCLGIAAYARSGVTFDRLPDGQVEWPAVEGWDPAAVPASRRAYVVAATMGKETRELSIDTETFYLLREKAGNTTRLYGDVRQFGDVFFPRRILEVVRTQARETATPFVIESVGFNMRLDPVLFTEDMPRAGRTGRGAGANPE